MSADLTSARPRRLPMVCSRAVDGDPVFFPHAEYRGRTLYFCTDYCLSAFQSDPERFLAVHRKRHERCEYRDQVGKD